MDRAEEKTNDRRWHKRKTGRLNRVFCPKCAAVEVGMEKECRIVYEGGRGEYEEKKSRFIGQVEPVQSEEEAQAFIASVRKAWWDARHHCYAFITGDGAMARCSDDGEPAGTAGRPILEVLQGAGIRGAVCVVTRYFGGTLLGTGGLVRAYTKASSEAVKASRVLVRREGFRLGVRTDYADLGKLQYLLGQNQIPVLESDFAADVVTRILTRKEEHDRIKAMITEQTGGRARFDDEEQVFFAVDETGAGKPVLLGAGGR